MPPGRDIGRASTLVKSMMMEVATLAPCRGECDRCIRWPDALERKGPAILSHGLYARGPAPYPHIRATSAARDKDTAHWPAHLTYRATRSAIVFLKVVRDSPHDASMRQCRPKSISIGSAALLHFMHSVFPSYYKTYILALPPRAYLRF